MRFRVTATSLNLRSQPKVTNSNRLAVLPNGHTVEKVAEAAVSDWWEVSTQLNGAHLTGFVSSAFLAPSADFTEPPPVSGVVPVHLEENKPTITRKSAGGRAFPLGEPGRPTRGNGSAANRVANLLSIVAYLDVEKNGRYTPGGGSTYCNIYAYDFCYLSGAYLPRVWWTQKAVADLVKGKQVPVRYGETVAELNANSLYEWLCDFGPTFGWTRTADADTLQAAANQGSVSVICAQRKDLNRSGHIAAVVPENPPHSALRIGSAVDRPLQSQAGSTNFRFSHGKNRWWTGSQFRAFGFWVNA